MDILSTEELLEQLDLVIASLEANEDAYYIALDLIHQAREEIKQVSFDQDNEQ